MLHPSSVPATHREFLDRAVPRLAADPRIVGIAATGSYADNAMDEFSDLDLVLACDPACHASLMRDQKAIAGKLGPLVAAFMGDHVGEPRLLICLYGPPALHVDIKIVTLADLAHRVDEPIVLWESERRMTDAYATSKGVYPQADPQWIEDRFWVWVHYGELKVARGELQESLDFLSFLRVNVLGPLGLAAAGLKPAGVRRVEAYPALAGRLARTVGRLDRGALIDALRCAIRMYVELRPGTVDCKRDAESVAVAFLDQVDLDVRQRR